MSKENVILIDYDAPDDWEFHKAIEKTTGTKWTVYKAVSNENHGGILQKLIRYAKYFLTPMKIAKNRNNYGKVLAWQQFYGLILAFYFRLMHVKESPEIVVLTFIYKPKKSLIGKIYDKFMRYIVTSGYIKYFVVFSESEKRRYADYFDIPESQFIFETLGYEDKTKDVPRLGSEDFYLAAGRSNRDYKFLTEAWSKRKEKLEIICDTLNLKSAIENIKRLVKRLLCPLQCLRFGIKNQEGNLYIGKACKIVNAKAMRFGKNVSIMPYTMLLCHEGGHLEIGEGAEIGMFSRVASQGEVIIGKNVFSGPHIFIADYNHEYRDVERPIKNQGNLVKPSVRFNRGGVSIGDDTWIGTNVVIAGTVEIGKHCVIGANSVVTHDIPDYSVVAGCPAKVIKQIK